MARGLRIDVSEARTGRRLPAIASIFSGPNNAALRAIFRLPTPSIALVLNHCGIGLRCTRKLGPQSPSGAALPAALPLTMLRRAAALAALLLGCGDAAGIGDARRRDTDTTRHGDAGDEVQSMLGALLESMSFAISQLYADRYDFLRTRAWYGNSHIGNRPIQARAYYDLARKVAPGTICELSLIHI